MSDPFVHEIRVGWGDCDPARIAYTGNIPAWALEAIEAWWRRHLGGGWYEIEFDHGFGTPFVHMDMDFRAPITPRHVLCCEVGPIRLGATSITFAVTGSQDGTVRFEGRFVCVFVAHGTMQKRSPPPEVRALVAPMLQAETSRVPRDPF